MLYWIHSKLCMYISQYSQLPLECTYALSWVASFFNTSHRLPFSGVWAFKKSQRNIRKASNGCMVTPSYVDPRLQTSNALAAYYRFSRQFSWIQHLRFTKILPSPLHHRTGPQQGYLTDQRWLLIVIDLYIIASSHSAHNITLEHTLHPIWHMLWNGNWMYNFLIVLCKGELWVSRETCLDPLPGGRAEAWSPHEPPGGFLGESPGPAPPGGFLG